jgi:hypothetical protein
MLHVENSASIKNLSARFRRNGLYNKIATLRGGIVTMMVDRPIRQSDDLTVETLRRLSEADAAFDRHIMSITKKLKPNLLRKRILRESVILHHRGVNAPISHYEAELGELSCRTKVRQEIALMVEVGALSMRKAKNDARFKLIYPTSVLISVLGEFASSLMELSIF